APAALRGDSPHCSMQVPGTRIVAESLPTLTHLMSWRRRQIFESRVPLQEARIELDDARDLGLLEHDFRDQHGIGVANSAPRQLPAMTRIPSQHATAKGTSPQRRSLRTWHGTR